MNNEAENRENTGKDLADQVGKAPVLVTRSSLPPLEDYVEKLKAIWDSAWLTNMGQFHEELKQELKEYLQVSGLELFVNGHMALEMILQAMELKGEVITTPFSFASTTHAIVRNGLTPVFCDIREDNFTLDADKLEDLITEKTCAIVPTHVYGNICDVEKIQEIADRHGLKVIYDAHIPLEKPIRVWAWEILEMHPCSASMLPRCFTPLKAVR